MFQEEGHILPHGIIFSTTQVTYFEKHGFSAISAFSLMPIPVVFTQLVQGICSGNTALKDTWVLG